jgi:hypothetical protein
MMKVGDLVKYRGKDFEHFDSWLGVIIEEFPGTAEYKKVQWVNSEDRNALERVNHKAKDLVVLSEAR